jgi:hypothetical protein
MLPIWLHKVLWVIASVLGYWGGALAGFLLGSLCVLPLMLLLGKERDSVGPVVGTMLALLTTAAFFAGLLGGSRLGQRLVQFLFLNSIPVRCPSCAGRTYPQLRSRTLTYRCPSCGHKVGSPTHVQGGESGAPPAMGKRRRRRRKVK